MTAFGTCLALVSCKCRFSSDGLSIQILASMWETGIQLLPLAWLWLSGSEPLSGNASCLSKMNFLKLCAIARDNYGTFSRGMFVFLDQSNVEATWAGCCGVCGKYPCLLNWCACLGVKLKKAWEGFHLAALEGYGSDGSTASHVGLNRTGLISLVCTEVKQLPLTVACLEFNGKLPKDFYARSILVTLGEGSKTGRNTEVRWKEWTS